MRVRQLIAMALFAPLSAFAGGGPFCVVSGAGSQCFYYDLNSCQSAARSMQGMCTANPSYGQQPVAPVYTRPVQPAVPILQHRNVADSFQQGYAEGQRRRIEREEHQARMDLMRAQAEAARSQAAAPQQASVMLPVYLCRSTERFYYSDSNEGGCAYLGALPAPPSPPSVRP